MSKVLVSISFLAFGVAACSANDNRMSQPPQDGGVEAAVNETLPDGSMGSDTSADVASESAAPFSVVEASIADMQAAMASGQVTSRQIVQQYLDRIARYEPQLNAVLALNDKALAEADALDQERANGHVRGPLHGIPIALKDLIQTTNMPTTGGMLAFKDYVPPYEATLVSRLRDAGAIILAKTTLTELANFMSDHMPDNYSAVGGFSFNPYDPRLDPREGMNDGRGALPAGSSSSGIGTTANFWAANIGTDTSGSILWPSNLNRLVGLKPTVGRISRHGVIPLVAEQDTAGPMTKTVSDAAILLGAMEGLDPHDNATSRCPDQPNHDYTPHLKRDGLKGARIGIPRAYFYDPLTLPGVSRPFGGLDDASKQVMTAAIDALKAEGAVIVDPADIPSYVDPSASNNLIAWSQCYTETTGVGTRCSNVMVYGAKRDWNAWFLSLGDSAPVKSVTALREFNAAHEQDGALRFGQNVIDVVDAINLDTAKTTFDSNRAKDLRLTATHGIDEVMAAKQLDAILFPWDSATYVGARPGYPTINVPFGEVPMFNDPPFPDGFDPKPLGFGVSFAAGACKEARLIEIAYAFEQATKKRFAPPLFP